MFTRRQFLAGLSAAPIVAALPKPSLPSEPELDRIIGRNIAILRGNRSRAELAAAVGCSDAFLRRVEAGRSCPAGLGARIANELSVEFSDLLADPKETQFLCELAELESDALADGMTDHDGTPLSIRLMGGTCFYGNRPCYHSTTEWLLSTPLECSAVGWAPSRSIWCRLILATEAEILHAMEERA